MVIALLLNSYTHTYVGLPVIKKHSASKNISPLQIGSGSFSQKYLNKKPSSKSKYQKYKDPWFQLQEKVAIVSAIA